MWWTQKEKATEGDLGPAGGRPQRDIRKPHPATAPATASQYVLDALNHAGVEVKTSDGVHRFQLAGLTFTLEQGSPGMALLRLGNYVATTYGLDYKTQLGRLVKLVRSEYRHQISICDQATTTIAGLSGINGLGADKE